MIMQHPGEGSLLFFGMKIVANSGFSANRTKRELSFLAFQTASAGWMAAKKRAKSALAAPLFFISVK